MYISGSHLTFNLRLNDASFSVIVKFHYSKKFIYITKILNAHYIGVHIHYFGSDLLITTTIVKFHYFTFRE